MMRRAAAEPARRSSPCITIRSLRARRRARRALRASRARPARSGCSQQAANWDGDAGRQLIAERCCAHRCPACDCVRSRWPSSSGGSLEFLAPLIKDSDSEVRQATIRALGLQREWLSDDELLPLLHDPERDVQRSGSHCSARPGIDRQSSSLRKTADGFRSHRRDWSLSDYCATMPNST